MLELDGHYIYGSQVEEVISNNESSLSNTLILSTGYYNNTTNYKNLVYGGYVYGDNNVVSTHTSVGCYYYPPLGMGMDGKSFGVRAEGNYNTDHIFNNELTYTDVKQVDDSVINPELTLQKRRALRQNEFCNSYINPVGLFKVAAKKM